MPRFTSYMVKNGTVACSKCVYFKSEDGTFGMCRRHAPRPFHKATNEDVGDEAQWAFTNGDDWCGEFEMGNG